MRYFPQAKKYWLFLPILILLGPHLLAQAALPEARLIFFRNTGALKSATACHIYQADQLICKVGNKTAWTSTFEAGTYDFRSLMSLDRERGKAIELQLEPGKLYLVEINLKRKGQQQVIPSAGYYFELKQVSHKRVKGLLKQRFIVDAIQKALFEEMKQRYLKDQ